MCNFKRFPKDVRTYGIDKQFLWGKNLLVTPVLDPGVDHVIGYFPEGLWYDFFTVRCTSPPSTFCLMRVGNKWVQTVYLQSVAIFSSLFPRVTLFAVRVKNSDSTHL